MSYLLRGFRRGRCFLSAGVKSFGPGVAFVMLCCLITSDAVAATWGGAGWLSLVAAQKAVERAEKRADPDSMDLALSLNNLAGCYYFRAQYAAAEPLFRRATLYPRTRYPAENFRPRSSRSSKDIE